MQDKEISERIQFVNTTLKEFTDTTTPLFKMVDFDHLPDMVDDSRAYLWFANPSTWNDAFEKRFVEMQYKPSGANPQSFPWLGRVYCCCFSHTRVYDAQWHIDERMQSRKAQFKVRREPLLQALDTYAQKHGVKVFVGNAVYQTTKTIEGSLSKNPVFKASPFDINDDLSLARLLLLKRYAFKYENEVRIIIVKDTPSEDAGIQLPFANHVRDLFQSVTFIPKGFATECIMETLKTKYSFDTHGYPAICKSHLFEHSHPSHIKI